MEIVSTHYINGRFVESHGSKTLDIVNPTNRKQIGRVTLGDESDIRRAVSAAKEAFKHYSRTSLNERAEYLKRLHDSILERSEEHIALRTKEYGGVPLHNVFAINGAAKVLGNMIKSMFEMPFHQKVGAAEVILKPVGVAGLITPWNSAVFMVCNKLAPALAAGCTVVVKASELSALQIRLLSECVDAADLPPGVVNIVHGNGEVAGMELVKNPNVTKISFTGSTSVGKTVLRASANYIKRVTLELGGKSAHLILEDADFEQAVGFALEAGFRNNGQACIAGSRILVPISKLDIIKELFLQKVPKWKVGNPEDEGTVIGPLVSEKQYNSVRGYIRKGIEEGARILVGGEGQPDGLESGNFVKPTIFVDVDNHMTIAQEEIFGPVLSVITYTSEEEAVRIANDSIYGLQAWVSTSDREHGRQIAEQIDAGGVMVNRVFDLLDEAGIPAGGFKQSGIGREFGVYGLSEYLEPQAIFA